MLLHGVVRVEASNERFRLPNSQKRCRMPPKKKSDDDDEDPILRKRRLANERQQRHRAKLDGGHSDVASRRPGRVSQASILATKMMEEDFEVDEEARGVLRAMDQVKDERGRPSRSLRGRKDRPY